MRIQHGPRDGHLLSVATLLFLCPNLLFATALERGPGVVLAAGTVLAGVSAILRPRSPGGLLDRPVRGRDLGLCACLAWALLVLGGEGHFFFANWDWLWRDAVLADLRRGAFLPLYAVAGHDYILRAPLGMYVLPALVARWGTLAGGHIALLVQNTVLLTVILYGFTALVARRAALVIGLVVMFSGLDLVGTLIGAAERGHPLSLGELPSHLEAWSPYLQYSSAVTQFFWVPNHALPGWWAALLAVLCARRDITVGEFGLSLAGVLFWSPFAFAGALPFLVCSFFSRLPETCRDPGFYIRAGIALCFLPVAAYLEIDAERVPRAFLFSIPLFWFFYLQFLIFEIPHGVFVFMCWDRLEPAMKAVLRVAFPILFVLPAFQFGASNDLVMRASIPALTILSLAFGTLLAEGFYRGPAVLAPAIALVAVGAATPAAEIVNAVAVSRFAVSDCNLLSVWQTLTPKPWLANYLAAADAVPSWLLKPPAGQAPIKVAAGLCWPDHPFNSKLSIGDKLNHASSPPPLKP